MKGIETWMSSTQWTPHYPCRKQLGWSLGQTPSSPSPDLRDNNFYLSQFWFFEWPLYSYLWVLLSQSSVLHQCICGHVLVTETSIHTHFRIKLLPVSRYLVRFCNVFRVVLHVCLAFPGRSLFPDTWYVCVWNGLLRRLLLLLLLALPIPLQRDLGCGPWCRKPFRKVLDIRFEQSHCQCNLLVLWRRSWLQMISFARILFLNTQHLGCVSNWFHMELFEELCNRKWGFSSSGSLPKRFNGVRKTAWRALSSSFPPRITPLPE